MSEQNAPQEQKKPKTLALNLEDKKNTERRKGLDPISRMYRIMAFFSWIVFIIGIFMTGLSTRYEANMISRVLGLKSSNWEDTSLFRSAFFIFAFNAVLCAVGLYLNSKRMKRRGDTYSKSLIAFFLLSVLAGTIILFNW